MPKYQFYFDTQRGEIPHRVQIEDGESLAGVLNDILAELNEEGDVLEGEGDPQAMCNGRLIHLDSPLPNQGVKPNDVIRVSLRPRNG